MIRPSLNSESALSEYIGLLIQLHQLIAAGQGDSEPADALRDRMDRPWKRLNARQQELADGLSADLYSLGTEGGSLSAPSDDSVECAIRAAIQRDDWAHVLQLVRASETSRAAATSAILRGHCWAHLIQPSVAILFLESANRFQPLAPEDECMLLACMIQAGRANDALTRARDIARTANDPILLLAAADIIFVAALSQPSDGADAMFREAVELAERGLAVAEAQPASTLLDVLRVNTLLRIALTHDHFGDRKTAVESCKRALQIDPDRDMALELFGFLSFDEFSASQKDRYRHRFQQELARESASNAAAPLIEVN